MVMLKHIADEWIILSKIGAGSYGLVYKCQKINGFINNDQVDIVAVKVIKKEKFKKNETDILEKIRLWNIPRYYSHAMDDEENVYIYMEFIDGENLSTILKRKKNNRFKESRIVSMVTDLTKTLTFLHKHHVLHRDIKCSNIVLDKNKNLKLIDFGASTIQDKKKYNSLNYSGDSVNNSGSGSNNNGAEKQSVFNIQGTFMYMAPEVRNNIGKDSRKSDVWSLGVTIIEMAGGDIQERDANGLPFIPDHLSADLKDFISQCVVYDPKKRCYMEQLLSHKLITGHTGNRFRTSSGGSNGGGSGSFENGRFLNISGNGGGFYKNKNNNSSDHLMSTSSGSNGSGSNFPLNKFEARYERPSWEIDFDELVFNDDESNNGSGNFGDVKRGMLNETDVAIKFVRKAHSEAVTVCDTFYHEVLILSGLRSPYIVQFIAATIKYGETEAYHCIISEWMVGGNLRQFLTNHHKILDHNPHLRVKFALDMARGMLYLHKQHPAIIHRDLTANNVLLDYKREMNSNLSYNSQEFTLKITDFGLSSEKNESKKLRGGSLHYQAPENIKNESPVNEKSDVYSFGLLVWELFSYSPPNTIYTVREFANLVCKDNYRPPIPNNVPSKFVELIQLCWNVDPNVRPLFNVIIEKLKDINSTYFSHYPSLFSSPSTPTHNSPSFNSTNHSPMYYTKSFGPTSLLDYNSSGGGGNSGSNYIVNTSRKNSNSSDIGTNSETPEIITTDLSQEDWEDNLKKLDLQHQLKTTTTTLSLNESNNNNNDNGEYI